MMPLSNPRNTQLSHKYAPQRAIHVIRNTTNTWVSQPCLVVAPVQCARSTCLPRASHRCSGQHRCVVCTGIKNDVSVPYGDDSWDEQDNEWQGVEGSDVSSDVSDDDEWADEDDGDQDAEVDVGAISSFDSPTRLALNARLADTLLQAHTLQQKLIAIRQHQITVDTLSPADVHTIFATLGRRQYDVVLLISRDILQLLNAHELPAATVALMAVQMSRLQSFVALIGAGIADYAADNTDYFNGEQLAEILYALRFHTDELRPDLVPVLQAFSVHSSMTAPYYCGLALSAWMQGAVQYCEWGADEAGAVQRIVSEVAGRGGKEGHVSLVSYLMALDACVNLGLSAGDEVVGKLLGHVSKVLGSVAIKEGGAGEGGGEGVGEGGGEVVGVGEGVLVCTTVVDGEEKLDGMTMDYKCRTVLRVVQRLNQLGVQDKEQFAQYVSMLPSDRSLIPISVCTTLILELSRSPYQITGELLSQLVLNVLERGRLTRGVRLTDMLIGITNLVKGGMAMPPAVDFVTQAPPITQESLQAMVQKQQVSQIRSKKTKFSYGTVLQAPSAEAAAARRALRGQGSSVTMDSAGGVGSPGGGEVAGGEQRVQGGGVEVQGGDVSEADSILDQVVDLLSEAAPQLAPIHSLAWGEALERINNPRSRLFAVIASQRLLGYMEKLSVRQCVSALWTLRRLELLTDDLSRALTGAVESKILRNGLDIRLSNDDLQCARQFVTQLERETAALLEPVTGSDGVLERGTRWGVGELILKKAAGRVQRALHQMDSEKEKRVLGDERLWEEGEVVLGVGGVVQG